MSGRWGDRVLCAAAGLGRAHRARGGARHAPGHVHGRPGARAGGLPRMGGRCRGRRPRARRSAAPHLQLQPRRKHGGEPASCGRGRTHRGRRAGSGSRARGPRASVCGAGREAARRSPRWHGRRRRAGAPGRRRGAARGCPPAGRSERGAHGSAARQLAAGGAEAQGRAAPQRGVAAAGGGRCMWLTRAPLDSQRVVELMCRRGWALGSLRVLGCDLAKLLCPGALPMGCARLCVLRSDARQGGLPARRTRNGRNANANAKTWGQRMLLRAG